MAINLQNFFRFYDEDNANHVEAVNMLEKALPENLVKPDAAWIRLYRGGRIEPGAIDLHNFFKFYNERYFIHNDGVSQLSLDMPQELLEDTADWVEKYRTKYVPPVPPILEVPFYNQVDNYRDAHRTCNSSACAMVLEYLKPGTLIGPKGDDAYIRKVFAIGDTTDHSAQTKVLESYGVESAFKYDLTFDDLDEQLAKGKPVVIGILHRGSIYQPTGGHMCVVIGKTSKGDYVINDPYGSLNDNYRGPVSNGKGAIYTKEILRYRWCPGGDDGWGRIFE